MIGKALDQSASTEHFGPSGEIWQFLKNKIHIDSGLERPKILKIQFGIQKEGILIRKEEKSDDNRFNSMHKWASQLIELQRQIETKVQ